MSTYSPLLTLDPEIAAVPHHGQMGGPKARSQRSWRIVAILALLSMSAYILAPRLVKSTHAFVDLSVNQHSASAANGAIASAQAEALAPKVEDNTSWRASTTAAEEPTADGSEATEGAAIAQGMHVPFHPGVQHLPAPHALKVMSTGSRMEQHAHCRVPHVCDRCAPGVAAIFYSTWLCACIGWNSRFLARFSTCVLQLTNRRLDMHADVHDTGANLTIAEKLRGFPPVYVVTMNNPKRSSDLIHRLQLTEFRATVVEGTYRPLWLSCPGGRVSWKTRCSMFVSLRSGRSRAWVCGRVSLFCLLACLFWGGGGGGGGDH